MAWKWLHKIKIYFSVWVSKVFLMGHSRPLLYLRHFYEQLTIIKFSVQVADDLIQPDSFVYFSEFKLIFCAPKT